MALHTPQPPVVFPSGAGDDLQVYYVRAEAVRWIDKEWPGWVEVRFAESNGALVVIAEKVPVVDDGGRVLPGVQLPVALELPCELLDWVPHGDSRSAVVRLWSSVEDRQGRSVFNVNERCLTERP